MDEVKVRLLTIAEAAGLLRICRSTLYALMDSGELPYVKIGRSRRIQQAALEQLIQDHLSSAESGSPR